MVSNVREVYQNFKTLGAKSKLSSDLCEEDDNNPEKTPDWKRKTKFSVFFMDPFEHPDSTTE